MTQPSKPRPRSATALIHRILSAPDLVNQVQSLPAPTLLKLVHKIGLEDSSEILSLASTEQLHRVVDEDLWRNTGKKEEFDPARFLVWLQVLEEMGYQRAGARLSEMDEDFLTLALSHYLFVLELEAVSFLRAQVIGDGWEDDRLEKILESYHSHEFGDLLALAKPHAPWDTLHPLLLALEESDSSMLGRILQRLALAGEAKAEREGGLYEVLTSEEMLEGDASFAREQRRTRDGFVPASDAAAFVAWVKSTPKEKIEAMNKPDPVSQAYFRDYKGLMIQAPAQQTAQAPSSLLLELLEDEKPPQLLLTSQQGEFPKLLASLDEEEHGQFLLELNFLAQVVMQTEKQRGGALRPAEAAERVMKRCEIGLAYTGKKRNPIQLFALGYE
jgi:hypothetical protein